jgi:hypothetical protein
MEEINALTITKKNAPNDFLDDGMMGMIIQERTVIIAVYKIRKSDCISALYKSAITGLHTKKINLSTQLFQFA